MALTRFGFIVAGPGLSPRQHRMELRSDRFTMIVIGVSTVEEGPAVACDLVAEGVELLELCGAFGPLGTAAVIAAIGEAIPVGAVAYGPESIDAMYHLFAA